MKQLEHINIETSDGVSILRIDKQQVLNALSTDLLTQLATALEMISEDAAVRVLIITGSGRAFVAGADISEMRTMNREQAFEYGKFGSGIFRKIETLKIPVIAAINGFALGGGLELAMACDIRLASENAKMGQPEVGLGITPGFSGTQRLARLVGKGKAKELIYTGATINADEALRIGLVNNVFSHEDLMQGAIDLAKKIAANAPIAVSLSKKAINDGMQTDIDSAISIENGLFADCFKTNDQKEGMEAFLAKRTAEWKNS